MTRRWNAARLFAAVTLAGILVSALVLLIAWPVVSQEAPEPDKLEALLGVPTPFPNESRIDANVEGCVIEIEREQAGLCNSPSTVRTWRTVIDMREVEEVGVFLNSRYPNPKGLSSLTFWFRPHVQRALDEVDRRSDAAGNWISVPELEALFGERNVAYRHVLTECDGSERLDVTQMSHNIFFDEDSAPLLPEVVKRFHHSCPRN